MKHKVAVPSYNIGSDNARGIHSASDAAIDAVKAYLPIVFMTQLRNAWRNTVAAMGQLRKYYLKSDEWRLSRAERPVDPARRRRLDAARRRRWKLGGLAKILIDLYNKFFCQPSVSVHRFQVVVNPITNPQ